MTTMDPQGDVVIIAVMGATGSGKSTFINLASGSQLQVGNSLESCTADVQVAPPFMLDGKLIVLVDTPGFDDTYESEAEILRRISGFLAANYEADRKLNGVILLHRISDYRVGGIARKNFRLFRKLCGEAALKSVVIATNMWGNVSLVDGERREKELSENELFFKPALDSGARVIRHYNTTDSTHEIIRQMTGFPPEALRIQHEIVDEGKPIVETDAGMDLKEELHVQMQKHREEMRQVRERMAEMKRERERMEESLLLQDQKHAKEMGEVQNNLQRVAEQLKRVESAERRLREGIADDQMKKDKELRRIEKAFEEKLKLEKQQQEARDREQEARQREQENRYKNLEDKMALNEREKEKEVRKKQAEKIKEEQRKNKELQDKLAKVGGDLAEKRKGRQEEPRKASKDSKSSCTIF